MNNEIINQLLSEKIIIIVRGVEGEKLLSLADALYEGGVRFMEIPYTADKEERDEITAENIRALTERMAV